MIFNHLLGIWCANCNSYKNPHLEVYLPDGSENEGRIKCLKCDIDIGFTWDLSWIEYWKEDCQFYYFYHNKSQCRCVQEETNCEGKESDCNYKAGKECYLADLGEENE